MNDESAPAVKRPSPKEIAQKAWDAGHVPTFLAALCELLMCSDPWPASAESEKELKSKADAMSQRLGFTDWVEAYHGLETGQKLGAGEDPARHAMKMANANSQKNFSRFVNISHELNNQDNRCTANPMFCVRMKVREVAFDPDYVEGRCWRNAAREQVVYDDDKDFVKPKGESWEMHGYKDRWEVVMVAFTEKGCREYLDLDGHNVRRRAFRGEVEIYAESFNRCPEMIAIRESLMTLTDPPEKK